MLGKSAFLLLLAMSASIVFAADDDLPPGAPGTGGVIFVRAIFQNNSPVANSSLIVLARTNNSESVFRLITDSSGRFVLSLAESAYELDSILDRYETPGIDFASTASVQSTMDGNATLIFYPTGSIAGKVSEGGSHAAGAWVKIACLSQSFDYERVNGGLSVKSGDAGNFIFRALPTGTCVVSSSAGSASGSVEVLIEHGQVGSAEIQLEKTDDYVIFLYFAGGAITVAALAFAFFRQRSSGHPTAGPSLESLAKSPPRQSGPARAKEEKTARASASLRTDSPSFDIRSLKTKAVLATLSEREREIAVFLLKCGGRAKRSTIQHKLLIPKTSLLRNLRSLERRNVISLSPFGRNLLAEINGSLFE